MDTSSEDLESGVAGGQIGEFLKDPPEWFHKQVAVYAREGMPERLLNPLASAVAYECLGDAHRWRETRPLVEDKVREMAP